jgi:uncharacterized protein YfaA (DUF2138 family)
MHNTRVTRWIASLRMPRRPFVALAIVLIASLQVAGLYRASGWRDEVDTSLGINVDFGTPDVLIRTRSLSSFFRDLLKVPIARDLFQEDLAFYYETHPGRLGLAGTMRRIAYEHNLTWSDRLVSSVFDEPADVLLWRGPKGSLDYWAIAMSRGTVASVLQQAATIVASDTQLSRYGEIDVDGASIPLYALELASDRKMLLASYRDRVVVLSDAGMILGSNADGQARDAVAGLLSADGQKRSVFERAFPSAASSGRNAGQNANRSGDARDASDARDVADAPVHSVAARLHFASFGYQRFFPGVEALKFEFGGGSWSTSLLMNPGEIPGGTLGAGAPWTAVPANAAFCAMLPIDWSQGPALLAGVKGMKGETVSASGSGASGGASGAEATNAIADLAKELDGPAVVCWYADGRIHTPLVAATLKTPRTDLEPLFTTLFDWSINRIKAKEPKESIEPKEANEAKESTEAKQSNEAKQPKESKQAEAPLSIVRPAADEALWQRELEVPYSAVDEATGRPEPGTLTITLGVKGRHIFFSPDADQVTRAFATVARRYPSMADVLPRDSGATLSVIAPKALASLARAEALVMLPPPDEPVFRAAAERHLLPRLDRMARHPAYRLTLPAPADTTRRWHQVRWQELAR